MLHKLEFGSNEAIKRNFSEASGDEVLATSRQTLIDELESAIVNRNIASRADVLRRVTDLFVTGSDSFDNDQLTLFDDIMGRLVSEIENSARAAFGERIAKIRNAPSKISCTLALDESIEVAGPLLMHSEQIDENILITSARTKSQKHLFAISQRRMLSENVTDVLVERGDQQVVVSTAANTGAQFSQFGYSTLVTRSQTHDDLALTVWSRSEIPREYLLALFETASDTVRLKLEAANSGKAALIRDLIKRASDKIQEEARERSPKFLAAQAMVKSLHEAGTLTEERLREFAQYGKFDEVAVALSLLGDMPMGATERALVLGHGDQVLVLAKSIGLSWDTTKAVLLVKVTDDDESKSTYEIEQWFSNFKKLKPETARAAIQFYRLQERAANSAQN